MAEVVTWAGILFGIVLVVIAVVWNHQAEESSRRERELRAELEAARRESGR